MPTTPRLPPHDRTFARLERFQVACPGCGRVLITHQGRAESTSTRHGRTAAALKDDQRARRPAQAQRLVFNPFTQRLSCPHCTAVYTVGLVLYPVVQRAGALALEDPPADIRPTKAERHQLRQRRLAARNQGGAYVLETPYQPGQDVNLHVAGACTCSVRWVDGACPVHGTAR